MNMNGNGAIKSLKGHKYTELCVGALKPEHFVSPFPGDALPHAPPDRIGGLGVGVMEGRRSKSHFPPFYGHRHSGHGSRESKDTSSQDDGYDSAHSHGSKSSKSSHSHDSHPNAHTSYQVQKRGLQSGTYAVPLYSEPADVNAKNNDDRDRNRDRDRDGDIGTSTNTNTNTSTSSRNKFRRSLNSNHNNTNNNTNRNPRPRVLVGQVIVRLRIVEDYGELSLAEVACKVSTDNTKQTAGFDRKIIKDKGYHANHSRRAEIGDNRTPRDLDTSPGEDLLNVLLSPDPLPLWVINEVKAEKEEKEDNFICPSAYSFLGLGESIACLAACGVRLKLSRGESTDVQYISPVTPGTPFLNSTYTAYNSNTGNAYNTNNSNSSNNGYSFDEYDRIVDRTFLPSQPHHAPSVQHEILLLVISLLIDRLKRESLNCGRSDFRNLLSGAIRCTGGHIALWCLFKNFVDSDTCTNIMDIAATRRLINQTSLEMDVQFSHDKMLQRACWCLQILAGNSSSDDSDNNNDSYNKNKNNSSAAGAGVSDYGRVHFDHASTPVNNNNNNDNDNDNDTQQATYNHENHFDAIRSRSTDKDKEKDRATLSADDMLHTVLAYASSALYALLEEYHICAEFVRKQMRSLQPELNTDNGNGNNYSNSNSNSTNAGILGQKQLAELQVELAAELASERIHCIQSMCTLLTSVLDSASPLLPVVGTLSFESAACIHNLISCIISAPYFVEDDMQIHSPTRTNSSNTSTSTSTSSGNLNPNNYYNTNNNDNTNTNNSSSSSSSSSSSIDMDMTTELVSTSLACLTSFLTSVIEVQPTGIDMFGVTPKGSWIGEYSALYNRNYGSGITADGRRSVSDGW